MNCIEKWIMRKILRKEVLQGLEHQFNITQIYALVREVVENEFTEDNAFTTDAFLQECFQNTQFAKK